MSSIVNIDDANFEAEVKNQKGLVLVDFWAAWCGPCKMIAPILEQISEEMKENLKIMKVNVDENQSTAAKFGIRSIPTVILFKDGIMVEQLVGVRPKEEIKKVINKHLQ
jgi:thioredoxin 1